MRGSLWPWVVEIGIGVAVPVFVVLVRMLLIPLAGDRAPYAFVFAGVVVACVLAGWRSGLIALVLGQLLTWILVVEPLTLSINPENARTGGLMIATAAQAMILVVIALYQREVDRAWASQENQMHLLSDALREIDHRTKNNYQTVVALILLQAQKAKAPDVKQALAEAADRVRAVSLASDQLALRSEDLGSIRLGDHLRELCNQIRRGLTRDEVLLECDVDEITAHSDIAIHLSIIVNELVTNALKHAFADRGGEIRVTCTPDGDGLELQVSDNGSGMKVSAARRSGLGTRLVERFVKELGADHEVSSSGKGTTHRIRLSSLA
jgi:two-component sensor histidine kinase